MSASHHYTTKPTVTIQEQQQQQEELKLLMRWVVLWWLWSCLGCVRWWWDLRAWCCDTQCGDDGNQVPERIWLKFQCEFEFGSEDNRGLGQVWILVGVGFTQRGASDPNHIVTKPSSPTLACHTKSLPRERERERERERWFNEERKKWKKRKNSLKNKSWRLDNVKNSIVK